MDFRDPRKRKNNRIRLMIGYGLIAIFIGITSIILDAAANGYGIDTKTGQITENGLLFLDSKPGGAKIYLNDEDQNATTSARMVLNAGNYTIKLSKLGYRDWKRTINLPEHGIARYVYPFLFPTKLNPAPLKTYTTQPGLVTESLDRRWLLVQTSSAQAKALSFDVYDTNNVLKQPPAVDSIEIPASILTGIDAGAGTFTVVEWSTDNNHLLLQHNYSGGSEFIVVSRADPATSFNVNKTLNVAPTQVAMFDKKVDQLYLYDATLKTLRQANPGKQIIDPLVNNVLAFKVIDKNMFIYVTADAKPGQVTAHVWDNGKIYSINSFAAGNKYLIDAAQFQGHWYYALGSDAADRVNIYKDPLDNLRDPTIGKAIPMYALTVTGGTKVSFSANTRFVEVEAGQQFGVYDFETDTPYQYTITTPLAEPMEWMDGHRLIGVSGGNVVVMDYDSTNSQALMPTSLTEGAGMFSRDYNQMFTLASGDTGSSIQRIDMRAGIDLPKSP
jgi:hypothetical protein